MEIRKRFVKYAPLDAGKAITTLRASVLAGDKEKMKNLSGALNEVMTSATVPKETLHSIAQIYLDMIQPVQDKIDAQLKKLGVSVDDIQHRVDLLQQDLLQRIARDPALAKTPAAQTIAKLKMIPLKALNTMSDMEALSYYSSCGIDGTHSNAFVDVKNNTIVLCPGYLLDLVSKGGNPEFMDFVLGHEMGHPIDAARPSPTKDKDFTYLDNYKKLIVCMMKQDKNELADVNQFARAADTYLHHYYNCSLALAHQHPRVPDDEMAALLQRLTAVRGEIYRDKKAAGTAEFIHENYGIPENIASHLAEVTADEMGRETVGDMEPSIPVANRPKYLLSAGLTLMPENSCGSCID